MYGTGWVPGAGYKYDNNNNNPQNYNNNQGYYGGAAAPPYSSTPMPNQQTGNTFNSNQGYYGQQNYGNSPYGGQQSGIELQQPSNSYQPNNGGHVYTPPPNKNDGIVR
jgi:hypothetical protein